MWRRSALALLVSTAGLLGCKDRAAPRGPAVAAPGPSLAPGATVAPAVPAEEWPPPPPSPTGGRPRVDAAVLVATLNGDPGGPKAEAMEGVLQGAVGSFQACLDPVAEIPVGQTRVQLSYRVQPTGAPSDVTVAAAGVPAAASECLKKAVEGLKFPPFAGGAISGSYPFTYSRSEQRAP